MSGVVCAGRSRWVAAGGFAYGTGGAGVCGGVLRSTTEDAVVDHRCAGPDDQCDRRILGATVARVPAPPADAEQRARRLARDLDRYRTMQVDIAVLDEEITELLAGTDGQILTTLPGVAVIRAAAFAAHSLPIRRFPDAEHLHSATGLAPALYQPATLRRRGRISRQGLAEHRDALMCMAWGLSLCSPCFAQRDAELRARGMAPVQARVALARNVCRLAYRLLLTQQPFDEERYRQGRLSGQR
jgi:transposase